MTIDRKTNPHKSWLGVLVFGLIIGCWPNQALASFDVEKLEWKPEMLPEAWQDYSAVVTHREQNYRFDYEGLKVVIESEFGQQILLRDQAAIREYSEFSFPKVERVTNSVVTVKVSFKVYVTDLEGKTREYNSSDAIVDENIEDGERSEVYRISLPKLKPGYRVTHHITRYVKFSVYGEFALAEDIGYLDFADEDLPVYRSIIDVFKKGSVVVASYPYNGAPQIAPGKEEEGGKRTHLRSEMQLLQPKQDYRWSDFDFQNPSIYLRVGLGTVKTQSTPESAYFKDTYEKHLDTITPTMIATCFKRSWRKPYSSSNYKVTKAWNKYQRKRFKSAPATPKEKAIDAYYWLRHREYFQDFEKNEFRRKADDRSLTNKEFAEVYTSILRFLGIKYDIAVVPWKKYVPAEMIPSKDDFQYFVRVNLPNDTLWAYNFNMMTAIGQLPSRLEGREVLLLNEKLDYSAKSLATTKPQLFDKTQSSINNQLTVNWSPQVASAAQVNHRSTYQGYLKPYHQVFGVNRFDLLADELNRFNSKGAAKVLSYKKFALTKRFLDERKREENEFRNHFFEYDRQGDYEGLDLTYNSFELLKDGRWHDQPELELLENYALDGLIVSAGGNDLMMAAGRLLGDQVKLSARDLDRQSADIRMSCARTFQNTIRIAIPEGYVVEGLEAFDRKVENATGGFTSQARIEGNEVVIETSKYYNHKFEKLEDWPLMVAFLQEAYAVSQLYLVFVKQNGE